MKIAYKVDCPRCMGEGCEICGGCGIIDKNKEVSVLRLKGYRESLIRLTCICGNREMTNVFYRKDIIPRDFYCLECRKCKK